MSEMRWRHRAAQTTEPEQQPHPEPGSLGEGKWQSVLGRCWRGNRLGCELGLLDETAVQEVLMADVVASGGGIDSVAQSGAQKLTTFAGRFVG